MTRTIRFLGLSVACTLFATAVDAQNGASTSTGAPSAEAADAGGLETIIVTAQKRQENLQNVPISVKAITGDQMRYRQINTAVDLLTVVPGLEVNGTLGKNVPVFSLRGISMRDFSFNQDGPVATYYDEVYKGNFPLLGVYMYDLERVEVLKGPQGTLYGQSTTGGAINVISRKPDFTTGGYVSVGYGNYDHLRIEGAAQTSLTDKLAVRLAFVRDRADGYVQNVSPGQPNVSSTDEYGFRGTLRYQADDFDFILRGVYSRRDPYYDGGIPWALGPKGIGKGIYEFFGGHSDFRVGLNKWQISDLNPARNPSTLNSVSATINKKLNDNLTLTSISAYDDGKLNVGINTDGSYLQEVQVDFTGRTEQFTQDLRVTSDYVGPFNYILGAYYSQERANDTATNHFFADIDVNGDAVINFKDCVASLARKLAPVACAQHNQFEQIINSSALYTDVNYALTDKVKLRAGLRYTHDKGALNDFLAQITGNDGVPVVNTIPGGVNLNATTGRDFSTNNVSGKAGIDYTPMPNVLLYLNYSRGYRRAAFNAQAFSANQLNVAKPETVDAVEGGLKSELLDRRLLLNGAIFWYGYENQQFVDPGTGVVQQLIGLPKSRIIGEELEVAYRLTEDITFSGNLSQLNTEILQGVSSGKSVAGNQLVQAPPLSITSAIDWTIPVHGVGAADVLIDGERTGRQYFDILQRASTSQVAYWTMNANIRLHTNDDRRGISFWAKNITDTYYYTVMSDFRSSLGFAYGRPAPPRTFGVTVDVKF
jgi:iron complex outermembrane receptor protein